MQKFNLTEGNTKASGTKISNDKRSAPTKPPSGPNGFKLVKTKENRIDLEETLFQDRHVFLHSEVNAASIDYLISQLFVLDKINHKPIYLFINSPGGSVSWGMALVNVIKSLKSPVINIASGMVASMGSIIFISGKERHCYVDTTFMFHDIFSGVVDYGAKMEARIDFQKKEWLMLVSHIRKHTKLNEEDLALMRNGELWLFSDEAVKKGIVDKII